MGHTVMVFYEDREYYTDDTFTSLLGHFPSPEVKRANEVARHIWQDRFALDMQVLIERVMSLYIRVNPSMDNFPQKERNNLTIRLRGAYLDCIKNLSLAAHVRSMRIQYLQYAQGEFANVRNLTDLARRQRHISTTFHSLLDETQAEIFFEIGRAFRKLNTKKAIP